MKKHNILVKNVNGKMEYKDIIESRTGSYYIHKIYDKEITEDNEFQALELVKLGTHCLYHDAIIDKKIHKGDKVSFYVPEIYIKFFSEARNGKKAFALLKNFSMKEREYLKDALLTIQKIYKKCGINVDFKVADGNLKKIFKDTKRYIPIQNSSYILKGVRSRSEEEAQALRQRFSKVFDKKEYNYSDFI